jgi:hypothetical protein
MNDRIVGAVEARLAARGAATVNEPVIWHAGGQLSPDVKFVSKLPV